jgi:hypothetical protein
MVCVKDVAQSVLYFDVECTTRRLEMLARTLRDTALDGRDLGKHISSLRINDQLSKDNPIKQGHMYGGVLARACNLRVLSVVEPDLSLLAMTTIHRTHTRCLEYLTLSTSLFAYPDVIAHISHSAHLRSLCLSLWFASPTDAFGDSDMQNLSWVLPNLINLTIDCQYEPYVAVLASLLSNSTFCSLQELRLEMSLEWDGDVSESARSDTEGQHFARFFSRHPLHELSLNFYKAAENILISILPHVHTLRLEIAEINAEIISHMFHAVPKLHIIYTGLEYDSGVQDGLKVLLQGGTGIREVTTDEWLDQDSWFGFLQVDYLEEDVETWQLRRMKYAALLAGKGIRFTDPQGKIYSDYNARGL